MELLNGMVVLLYRNTILFSIVAAPLYILTSGIQDSNFSAFSLKLIFFFFFFFIIVAMLFSVKWCFVTVIVF